MQEFLFWTTTQSFGEDADQSALLNRVTDIKSVPFKAMAVFLCAVVAGLIYAAVPILLSGNWDMGLMYVLMIATVGGMLAWALTGWSVRSEVKSGRKERQKSGVKDSQITIRLSEKGCAVKVEPDGALNQVFTWEDIGKIAESEELFFIAGKKIPGICLRKSALKEGKEEELRAFLQSKYAKPIHKYEIKTEKLQALLR